jgi:Xaa-Pro aminopeptidase
VAAQEVKHFAERRRACVAALGGDAALVVAPEAGREDGEFHHCASSDLYYLTGWEGEGAMLLRPGMAQEFLLFVPPRDEARERYTGPRPGLAEATSTFGAEAAFPFDELEERLPRLCQGYACLRHVFGGAWDGRLLGLLSRGREAGARNGAEGPGRVEDLRGLLGELRLRKDAHEQAIFRRAAAITVEGHLAGMRAGRPGAGEFEVQAAVEAEFRRHGAQGPAYASIVGGGANAAILHYEANRDVLHKMSLCLVDAGCRLDHYATDMTRTWPVSGRFTRGQRAFYERVLAAQDAAIKEARVGRPFSALEDAARAVLGELRHSVAHWVGLAVHDVGGYHRAGTARALELGMVLAIEPGIYGEECSVRIEDLVLVTEAGPEILTAGCPREPGEVERAVVDGRKGRG